MIVMFIRLIGPQSVMLGSSAYGCRDEKVHHKKEFCP